MDADLGAMFRWFATEGYRADIAAVRALHPELHGFEAGLRVAGHVQEERRT
jgi:hypothetical protein